MVMLFFMHVRHNTKLTVRAWQAGARRAYRPRYTVRCHKVEGSEGLP